MNDRVLSSYGYRVLKAAESCVLHVYLDDAGNLTGGYGHLFAKGSGVKVGDPLTQEWADNTLLSDVPNAEGAVRKFTPANIALSQAEFDAMTIFAFNVGDGGYQTFARNHMQAATWPFDVVRGLPQWDHKSVNINGVLVLEDDKGLMRRRVREAAVWCGVPVVTPY